MLNAILNNTSLLKLIKVSISSMKFSKSKLTLKSNIYTIIFATDDLYLRARKAINFTLVSRAAAICDFFFSLQIFLNKSSEIALLLLSMTNVFTSLDLSIKKFVRRLRGLISEDNNFYF